MKTSKSTDKVLVLNSGGADSLLTMYLLKEAGYDVHSLFIDYGQLNATAEYDLAIWGLQDVLQEDCKMDRHFTEKLSLTGEIKPDALENDEQEIPLRNFLFIAYATQKAYALGIGNVALGYASFLSTEYVDDNPLFLQDLYHLMKNNFSINLITPLAGYDKTMIYSSLMDRDVDVETLPVCNTPVDGKPCGICHKCELARAIIDTLKEERQQNKGE